MSKHGALHEGRQRLDRRDISIRESLQQLQPGALSDLLLVGTHRVLHEVEDQLAINLSWTCTSHRASPFRGRLSPYLLLLGGGDVFPAHVCEVLATAAGRSVRPGPIYM